MSNESITKKIGGKRVIFAAGFGNALEFFDFTIYNFFVVYIGTLFFPPSSDPNIGLLLAFGTFGVSFFMRPLGGIVIGAYADKFGRKPAMILTISLMTLGTLMIGVAPTYATAGYWGTLTLVAARLIQGLAAGGEVGASLSMLVESAPANRRGFYSSWTIATQGLSTIFGALTALSLTFYMPSEMLADWGWRIPFFIGVALAPIGCWLRLTLKEEAPVKTDQKQDAPKESTYLLLKEHFKVIVIGVILTIGGTVGTYISLYYYGTFSLNYLNMPKSASYGAMLTGGIVTFVGSLLVGLLTDRMGRKKLIGYARAAIVILAYPSFWLLVNYPTPAMLIIIVFIMASLTIIGAIPGMLIISELLPKRIRALGFSLVYSLGVAIFGGFAQFFATQSIIITGELTAPAWYLGGATLLSMLVLPLFKEPKQLVD